MSSLGDYYRFEQRSIIRHGNIQIWFFTLEKSCSKIKSSFDFRRPRLTIIYLSSWLLNNQASKFLKLSMTVENFWIFLKKFRKPIRKKKSGVLYQRLMKKKKEIRRVSLARNFWAQKSKHCRFNQNILTTSFA